ncbi:hypothetical protein CBR_g26342 [Chara braunii]|uniref:RING-type domain-containing protein n=1 Tax=Chara braunii TaxID=69332 RepID=A0A388L7Y7_CHABU|nr:hypothetical protein CBR_g26342 [Chara braunii]|eukprot:GBG78313.1 hypothetical protein CBR_g26342 [Chara braunii]
MSKLIVGEDKAKGSGGINLKERLEEAAVRSARKGLKATPGRVGGRTAIDINDRAALKFVEEQKKQLRLLRKAGLEPFEEIVCELAEARARKAFDKATHKDATSKEGRPVYERKLKDSHRDRIMQGKFADVKEAVEEDVDCAVFRKSSANKDIRRRHQGTTGDKESVDGKEGEQEQEQWGKQQQQQQQQEEDDDEEGEEKEEDTIEVPKPKAQRRGLAFTASGHLERSRRREVPPFQLAGKQENEKKGEPEAKKGGSSFVYESERRVQTRSDNRATATLETETEFDRDSRAIRERVLKQAQEALSKGAAEDSKLYRGLHGYTDHRAGLQGNWLLWLRGLLCKLMHDRGDYKSGWQLDREWNEEEEQRRELAARDQVDDEDDPQKEEIDEDDDLPFACFICRRPFIDPVVTKCKHYFCAHCALKHNSTSKNCAVCEKPTGGVFNTVREIVRKMQEEKEKVSGTLDGGKRSRGSWRS